MAKTVKQSVAFERLQQIPTKGGSTHELARLLLSVPDHKIEYFEPKKQQVWSSLWYDGDKVIRVQIGLFDFSL